MPNTPPPQIQFAKIDKFFGGIVRDDKNPNPTQPITGFLAMEELDPFTNGNYIQAEQIMSADTMPANTAIYARAIDENDTTYGIGSVVASTNPHVDTGQGRIVSMVNASALVPGSFTTLMTSSDPGGPGINTYLGVSASSVMPRTDLIYYKSIEVTNFRYLLYTKRWLSGGQYHIVLMKYNLITGKETGASQVNTADAAPVTADILDGFDAVPATDTLDTTVDTRAIATMKNLFGDIYITHGRYIAKFDRTGALTLHWFKLSNGLEAVDIEQVGNYTIIYCRDITSGNSKSVGVWWDLSTGTGVQEYFNIPMGGPCWIKNFRENVILFNANNGTGKFFRLTYPSFGAQIVELPGILLNNLVYGPVDQYSFPSMPKQVVLKDKFLYFGLNESGGQAYLNSPGKTGIYCLGQLDPDKPFAVFLSKRYGTSDYKLHIPWSLKVQGPNFYGDFQDYGLSITVGTQTASVRCATLNSPTRSSQAFLQTLWLDANNADRLKALQTLMVTTYPLPTATTVVPSIATDYGTSFTTWTRNDGTNMAAGNRAGNFTGDVGTNNILYSIKLAWTSHNTDTAKVTSLALYGVLKELAPQ